MSNLVAQFENYVHLHPDAIAIVIGEQSYTYYELNHYANYISHLLVEQGVTSTSIIAVMGDKSLEMVAGILAILKLKCAYMPLDSSYPTERIQFMLTNANVKYVISNKANEVAPQAYSLLLSYKDFDAGVSYHNPDLSISENDIAYVMHTSGSTGVPKGVLVPHRGVVRLLKETNYIKLTAADSILFHSNTSFDAGIFEIWAALINGARIVISPHMIGDLPAIFKLCKQQKITILLLATGLFHIFSTLDLEELDYLRYLVVGGDVMHSSAALRAIEKNPKMKIINGYGPAENTVFTTCLVINSATDVSNPVSIGKAITQTDVHLLDDQGQEVKLGDVGELYTSGKGVALGYINAPQLTAEKFISLPYIANGAPLYRTGDLARQLPCGNYIFIGRRDKQVKIRGFRVELSEVESTISALSFVEDVCVSATEGENKKLIAFIKAENTDKNKEFDVLSFLKTKLPHYCIPAAIELSNIFPLTANGKIDRVAMQTILREKYQQ